MVVDVRSLDTDFLVASSDKALGSYMVKVNSCLPCFLCQMVLLDHSTTLNLPLKHRASEVAAASMLQKMEKMRRSIHVLLVDHETNVHASFINMLEHFFLKVTTVKYASTGLAMLSKGKATIGLLLANIHSPDTCGYNLLQEAVRIDLPVILMLEEEDVMLTKRALEDGALLCIKKPITMETVRYFWQLVMYWEKSKTQSRSSSSYRGRELMMMMGYNNNGNDRYITHQNAIAGNYSEEITQNNTKINKCEDVVDSSSDHDEEIGGSLRTKVWTEWTQPLHDKFMAAVTSLGPGRCYPRDILEMMNVPGLTRMQVASHLQKCRSGTWIAPSMRKPKTSAAAKRGLCIANSTRFPLMPNSNPNQYSESDYLHHFPNVNNCTIQNFHEIPMADNVVKNVKVEKCENTSNGRDDDGKSGVVVVVKKEQE